jgi:UDP-N-acetyl-D-glucosamine dehydrogenase
MGIDLYEVIRAAATKPFGFVPYYPGPGLGGHCIPIDPFYLTWKAREYGINTRFIELAGEINTAMPLYVAQKTADKLNEAGMSLKGSRILLLGIAYKKNVDDMRESPSVKIMQLLHEKGAEVQYTDPFFPEFPHMRNFKFYLRSILLSAESIATFDAVILATDHDQFDYSLIKSHSKILIDTRGRFTPGENVVRA